MTHYIEPAVEVTEDGSHTLLHPVLNDSYHSLRGAVGESRHVFIENGLKQSGKRRVKIFEMGFGTGLNALLTLEEAVSSGLNVEYHAIELYPVDPEIARTLNYADKNSSLYEYFMKIHYSPWGKKTIINDNFTLTKYNIPLAEMKFDTTFDIIYFDAFSPDTQPDLWTTEIFSEIYRHTSTGGILVTYSAKGSVKRALRDAGFEVHRLPGALGKRHMVRAIKQGI